ncbi:MAG TPA: aromatic ring-hydroxylating dioxygenase subunit alpha [Alphaproteobacteria bacterium]
MQTNETTAPRASRRDSIRAMLEVGIPGRWWAVTPSRYVRDKPIAVKALGHNLVVWRDADGVAHVQQDMCPHRGAKLSQGFVHEGRLTCWYHGVQIDGDGKIAAVPAYPDCPLVGKPGVKTYPCIERNEAIFAYFPSAAHPDPIPFELPPEFVSDEWSSFLCTAVWQCNYQLALDNLVDPMHGSYLHAQSFTLAYGSKKDVMKVENTEHGFIVSRTGQRDVNFDWTEMCDTGAYWVRLDLPYPPAAGPGGLFRIIGFCTPLDADSCRVYFWRLRKVSGWQRDVWRFMYRNRLEERHWNVLEQDRVILEGIGHRPEREMLYQHDIGVSQLRRILQQDARAELDAAKASEAAA